MAESKENSKLETRSIRMDSETHLKLEELTKNFDNKNACISSLIQSYELELNKQSMPSMRKEIETFQAFVTNLQELYNNSLRANELADARIRTEYTHLIQSKDETIIDLQEKVKTLEESETKSIAEADRLAKENEEYQNKIKELEKQLSMASVENDKNNDVIKSLTRITTEYKGYAEENKQLKQQNDDLQKKNNELEGLKSSLTEKLKDQASKHNFDLERLKENLNIEKEKSVLELEKGNQVKLQEQQTAYSKKINEYESKIFKLIDEKTESKTTTTPKKSPARTKKSKAKESEGELKTNE